MRKSEISQPVLHSFFSSDVNATANQHIEANVAEFVEYINWCF